MRNRLLQLAQKDPSFRKRLIQKLSSEKRAGTPWPIYIRDLGFKTLDDILQIYKVLDIPWNARDISVLDNGQVSVSTRTFSVSDEDFPFLSKKISSLSYSDGMVEFVLKNKSLHE